jgi:hypothetical protein
MITATSRAFNLVEIREGGTLTGTLTGFPHFPQNSLSGSSGAPQYPQNPVDRVWAGKYVISLRWAKIVISKQLNYGDAM